MCLCTCVFVCPFLRACSHVCKYMFTQVGTYFVPTFMLITSNETISFEGEQQTHEHPVQSVLPWRRSTSATQLFVERQDLVLESSYTTYTLADFD